MTRLTMREIEQYEPLASDPRDNLPIVAPCFHFVEGGRDFIESNNSGNRHGEPVLIDERGNCVQVGGSAAHLHVCDGDPRRTRSGRGFRQGRHDATSTANKSGRPTQRLSANEIEHPI